MVGLCSAGEELSSPSSLGSGNEALLPLLTRTLQAPQKASPLPSVIQTEKGDAELPGVGWRGPRSGAGQPHPRGHGVNPQVLSLNARSLSPTTSIAPKQIASICL